MNISRDLDFLYSTQSKTQRPAIHKCYSGSRLQPVQCLWRGTVSVKRSCVCGSGQPMPVNPTTCDLLKELQRAMPLFHHIHWDLCSLLVWSSCRSNQRLFFGNCLAFQWKFKVPVTRKTSWENSASSEHVELSFSGNKQQLPLIERLEG